MRDRAIDLCGAEGGGRAPDMPLLAAGDRFAFRCAGCGGCCRGREDLVLSGYDLYRLARRLGLPPRITARAFCRSYIGAVSRLPVLRLAPVRAEGNNCPFLTGGRCAVHEARPLACALYPLGQEITREGKVAYYFQNTGCGGREVRATLADYLAAQGIPEREPQDVLWAVRCMALEQEAPLLGGRAGPRHPAAVPGQAGRRPLLPVRSRPPLAGAAGGEPRLAGRGAGAPGGDAAAA